MKRKQKRVLSFVVTSAMLFSSIGMEASAEPIEQNTQPVITANAESEPVLGMTLKENKEEAESEAESEKESAEETEDGSELESEDESEEDLEEDSELESEDESKEDLEEDLELESDSESQDESEEDSELESEDESKEDSENDSELESDGESQDESEEDSELESEDESKDESEEDSQLESDGESQDKSEEDSELESDGESQDESEEDLELESEDESKEESKNDSEESGEEPEEGMDDESEQESENDSTVESEEETTEVDEVKNPEEESSGNLDNLDALPPVDPIPDIHEHSWSVTWNYDGTYHWHECDLENCPVIDHSKKNGYAEHTYNDYGVCPDCGYDAMDGIAVTAVGDVPTYQEAYDAMTALMDEYPEGMPWTNFYPYGTAEDSIASAYTWKGGAIYGAKSAVGCMAFAFILSDAAFGNLPARPIPNGQFTFEDVKVGDILRINGNSHSVIVLKKSAGGVIVAEANYNKSVHWGRSMSTAQVKNADFIITRYPKGYVPSDELGEDQTVDNGAISSSLDWSLTQGGVLTISGNGAIPDYSQGDSLPWSSSEINVSTIHIEDGVTSIGDFAFYNSTALSVYIPDSVTSIGQHAFNGSSLLSVTIPGSVETIGNSAFRNCANLTSATVSEGVKFIEDQAFRACTSLAYIDFPASIESVGTSAFTSCTEMVSVRFKSGNKNSKVALGDSLFMQCGNLMSVTLPLTTDSIGDSMFSSCHRLPSLYIPATIQSISDNAFTSCISLSTISFGGSETQWNNIASPQLKGSLQSTKTNVVFDVTFDDPFAEDPDDPGDFDSCINHVDTNNDGKCDNCGETMSTDNTNPDDGNGDNNNPDDGNGDNNNPGDSNGDNNNPGDGNGDNNNPGGSNGDNNNPGDGNGDNNNPGGSNGGNNNPGGSNGGNNSSGSSNGSNNSSSSENNHPSNNNSSNNNSDDSNGTDNPTVSTSVDWKSDGSSVTTNTQKDGTIVTITNNVSGTVEMAAQLSNLAIDTAQKNNKAVALPITAVQASKDIQMAQTIRVYTQKDELVKVAIPTVSPTASTVAVIVNEDGSTSIIRSSVPTADGVVAALPDGATIKIVDNSKSFLDVPTGSWFENAVSFVSARELFYNTTETTFTPDAPMTYGMMATALARYDGTQTEGGATWYDKSMEWAGVRGIADSSNPDSNITCEQLATMLWKYQGSPAVINTPSDQAAVSQLNDTQKAMDWAVKNGIVSGFENGTFNAQSQLNRAQAAQIMMNFAQKTTGNSAQ